MASSYRHPPGLRRDDPDDTEGRALYRAIAEADARRSLGLARKVRLATPKSAAPDHGDDL